eukprot:c12557_g1_i1.p1 GENE.c12557_g1_i1~~c12557_g1_i1.p1  ORF type:complete len:411 (-),score=126.56 c12557_g1_i1:165-1355(-)
MTTTRQRPALLRLNRCFVAVLGLCSLTSRLFSVALAILFSQSQDTSWFGITCAFIFVSTLFDILTSCLENKGRFCRFLLWSVLSVLQLKPWLDTLAFFTTRNLRDYYNQDNYKQLKEYRAKIFLSTTLHSLPISFLICYILMLDLHRHLDENLLLAALVFSILSFALGTTLFVAGDDPTPRASVMVFLHILSQFFFRVLALSLVFVKFGGNYGWIVVCVSWLCVYLCGPKGTLQAWARVVTCQCGHVVEGDQPSAVCYRLLLTPLTFFVLINPVYSRPHSTATTTDSTHNSTVDNSSNDIAEPVLVVDSFQNIQYIWVRVMENTIMVVCFLWVGVDSTVLYEGWLHTPMLVIGAGAVCALLTGLTSLWLTEHSHHTHAHTHTSPNRMLYSTHTDTL